jgi:hypothetical protein
MRKMSVARRDKVTVSLARSHDQSPRRPASSARLSRSAAAPSVIPSPGSRTTLLPEGRAGERPRLGANDLRHRPETSASPVRRVPAGFSRPGHLGKKLVRPEWNRLGQMGPSVLADGDMRLSVSILGCPVRQQLRGTRAADHTWRTVGVADAGGRGGQRRRRRTAQDDRARRRRPSGSVVRPYGRGGSGRGTHGGISPGTSGAWNQKSSHSGTEHRAR